MDLDCALDNRDKFPRPISRPLNFDCCVRLFIEYGMLTEDKFYDKAEKFFLFKNTDGKYFTMEEYETLIKGEQTDKEKNLIYLYTNNAEEQYSFVEAAKNKGYDVLIMNNVLSTPLINKFEQKFTNKRFVRVDSEVAEHLIAKENPANELSWEEKNELPAGLAHYHSARCHRQRV